MVLAAAEHGGWWVSVVATVSVVMVMVMVMAMASVSVVVSASCGGGVFLCSIICV